MRNALAFPALCSVIAACTGCAGDPAATSASAPSFIVIPQSRYAQAFEAACEAARAERLSPEIADRQSGTISTTTRAAGSVAEPWTWHELTASELVEGTLAFERRRAHFEFVPTGFRPDRTDAAAPLSGPSLPGAPRGGSTALATADGAFELRVSVSIERQFRPGQQGSAYTRSMGSFWRDVTDATSDGEADGRALQDRSVWTPIARDERLERVLIARIDALLSAP